MNEHSSSQVRSGYIRSCKVKAIQVRSGQGQVVSDNVMSRQHRIRAGYIRSSQGRALDQVSNVRSDQEQIRSG